MICDSGVQKVFEIDDHETNELNDVKLRNDPATWDIEVRFDPSFTHFL